jgi:predicted Fe-Mo cluster-binding NifX family protein
MKILIAADGATTESDVAKRFGHAPYYLHVDTETMQLEATENKGNTEKYTLIKAVAGKGITTVIVGNVGPPMFDQLALNKM